MNTELREADKEQYQRNITSDRHCRPSVWEAGWARRLPTAVLVQNQMHRKKKTQPQTQKPHRKAHINVNTQSWL